MLQILRGCSLHKSFERPLSISKPQKKADVNQRFEGVTFG